MNQLWTPIPNLFAFPLPTSSIFIAFRRAMSRGVVQEYLLEARAAGFNALRIIHGRGIGVQREIVRAVLGRSQFVAGFGDAPAEAGGWGATIVTLR